MNTRFDPKDAGNRPAGTAGSRPVVETATDARQGRQGLPVLKVLISALVLVAIAFAVAQWWGEASDAPDAQTATPPAGSTTPQSSNAAPSADPAAAPPPASAANDSQSGN
ncbi:hypothetical protein M0654_18930 [Rhizobium sp. NTR19]|uniref:Uncharacterized protein n=1 Tax=Neorhizobium turbinariae TaxID=2937795 RepID=A0ABT0IW11_9HYPH|nr:hypothetical protein [Neorhizobium turbinariae]MCK8782058.1 hypothetical protein [Neorhizobium turbinariae]